MHACHYGDLPVWDLLFSSFRNPREFHGDCGFEDGPDRRLGAMLTFADVNAPLCGPAGRGARPRLQAAQQ